MSEFLVIGAIVAIFVGSSWIKQQPEAKRKKLVRQVAVALGIALAILLLLRGANPIMALIAGIVPFLFRALSLWQSALELLERGRNLTGSGAQQDPQPQPGTHPVSVVDMSVQQAAQILGVDLAAPSDEIVLAHRRLIQRMHPDRGGSDYLAAQINRAKDVLLSSREAYS